jgi:hypothetical protein
MHRLTALGAFALVATACCGCDAKVQRPVFQEALRHSYVDENGPMVVASIVGAAAPAGGMGGLNGLCTDQAWRMWVGTQLPEFEHVPSVFEEPDPGLPGQITTYSRTR